MRETKFRDMSEKEYNDHFFLLYTIYSIPNVILPLAFGTLADQFGVRTANMLFAFLVLLGQMVFNVGLALDNEDASWGVMFFGRGVFGLGGESLTVTMSALVARWFDGAELAFALGTNLAVARLGSVLNDYVSLHVAEQGSVADAGYVGSALCLLSFLLAAAVWYLDATVAKQLRDNKRRLLPASPSTNRHDAAALAVSSAPGEIERIALLGDASASETPAASTYKDRAGKREGEGGKEGGGKEEEGEGEEEEDDDKLGEKIDYRAIFKFPLSLWILAISCLSTYAAILPFNNIASQFLYTRFSTSKQDANLLMMIVFSVSAVLSPILGILIDRIGHRANLALMAAILITLSHLYMAATYWPPAVALSLLGIGYSVYAAALWPSIALVTPPAYHSSAYGVVTAIQNAGLAGVPALIHVFQNDCPKTYACVEYAFMGFGCVGVASGIALVFANAVATPSVLNLSQAQIAKLEADEKLFMETGDNDGTERDDVEGGDALDDHLLPPE